MSHCVFDETPHSSSFRRWSVTEFVEDEKEAHSHEVSILCCWIRSLLRHSPDVDEVYPGKPIFLSSDGNENYYTYALVLLVRTNRVVIFIAIK